MPGHFYHDKFLKSRSFSKTPIFDKKQSWKGFPQKFLIPSLEIGKRATAFCETNEVGARSFKGSPGWLTWTKARLLQRWCLWRGCHWRLCVPSLVT